MSYGISFSFQTPNLKADPELPKTTTTMPDIPSLLSQSVPLPPSSLTGVTQPVVTPVATSVPCPPPAILAQVRNKM